MKRITTAIVFFIIVTAFLFFFKAKAEKLPHKKEVVAFLDSLTYSALDNLLKEDVRISVDTKNGSWTLHNIFSYDKDGEIVNFKTRSGACVELSRIAYKFAKGLFGKDYRVTYLAAIESRFFPLDAGGGMTHYLIKITPFESGRALFIDPSYRAYDFLDNVKDYDIKDETSTIPVFDRGIRDVSLYVDTGYPLYLSQDSTHIFSIAVKRVSGKLDQDNYAILISATEQYSGARIKNFLIVAKQDGKVDAFRDMDMIGSLIDAKTAKVFIERIVSLFENLVIID
ncbi:hypothetical protein ACFL96_08205 [Thermoproteota archaeon]